MQGLVCATAILLLLGQLCASPLMSAEPDADARLERLLADADWTGTLRIGIGVTRRQTTIPAVITRDDLDYGTPKLRILLVAGLDGQ